MPEFIEYDHAYKIKLTPLEADIRLEDFHPTSPWREMFLHFGIGPVVYLVRQKDGRDVCTPTMDFLLKGARRRAEIKKRGFTQNAV